MADISALLTSNTSHYCSPPEYVTPMRRLIVPKGSGRRLGDFSTSDAGRLLIKPHAYADGVNANGLDVDRRCVDGVHSNPPYGDEIEQFVATDSYWGRTVGVPHISLLPARDDTAWCQEHVFDSADAWVHVRGRFKFWLLIPLHERDAAPAKKRKDGTERPKYFLRRFYPRATDDNLPAPFIHVCPGWALGPELGDNGQPSGAPFPSLIPFWADPKTVERDPLAEVDAFRELVRAAVDSVALERDAARDSGDPAYIERVETWIAQAECLLGSKRFRDRAPLDLAPFERLAKVTPINKVPEQPISIRRFAQYFGRMGKLTIARGPHRGVYIQGRRVG